MGGPDFSMMAEAGVLDAADETCRQYERVVDLKYLEQIRAEAKEFLTKPLSREAGLPSAQSETLKTGKMRSGLALSKS
jgi:hypothetical protein